MYQAGLLSTILFLSMIQFAHAEYSAGLAGSPYAASKWQEGNCPEGSYAVGILVRGGQYVDRLYIQCFVNGKVESKGGLTGINLANILYYNSIQKTVFCRGNRRLTGIKFKSGGYVDRVASIRCQNSAGGDTEYMGVGVGGSGGNYVQAYCRTGDHVTAIKGHAGSWVDNVGVYCD